MRMKWLFPVIAVALLSGITFGVAQSKRSRATKEFMRDKLELSQKVLEGVTTEDWDLVVAKGTKLSAMTEQADWRVFENPNYDQQSKLFKQQVDSLVAASRVVSMVVHAAILKRECADGVWIRAVRIEQPLA